MNNTSPAHSTTATAGGGGNGGSSSSSSYALTTDDNHSPIDLISVQDPTDENLVVLRADIKAELDKVVKSMNDDSWMFEGPRSKIHLISRPGTFLQKQTELSSKSCNLPRPK